MRDFIESVILGSFGSAGLLALAGFAFKTRISHWLSKDLERQKSQYARELEAYKVSLIAETEKIKATQEVKKQAALLQLQRKYAAFLGLQQSSAGLLISAASGASLATPHRNQQAISALITRVEQFISATGDVNFFLTIEERRVCTDYQIAIMEFMNHVEDHKTPLLPSISEPMLNKASEKENALNELIKRKLAELHE